MNCQIIDKIVDGERILIFRNGHQATMGLFSTSFPGLCFCHAATAAAAHLKQHVEIKSILLQSKRRILLEITQELSFGDRFAAISLHS